MSPSPEPSPQEPSDWFTATHWSVVQAAGSDATAAHGALEKLCMDYWPPLYGYIRRRGHDPHESEDLTQEFFARLLARNDFAALHPSRGKFRAFLLAAMNHFLANEWRKADAQKRGGGQTLLPLNTVMAEERYQSQAAAEPTPELHFDRRWAETVLERAGQRLCDAFIRDGREAMFRELNLFLSTPTNAGGYAGVAARLQMTEASVAKAVERLRRQYRELVRDEIAQTVSSPAELEEEMRYLLDVLTA